MSMVLRLAVVAVLFVAACGPASAGATAAISPTPPAAAVSLAPSPSAQPSPSPSPKPAAGAPTPAANRLVSFTGLRAGVYPVHLHSRCDGAQQFHILVLHSLAVGGTGAGAVLVPRGYFGRGLCVIVYGSSALRTVIATRQI